MSKYFYIRNQLNNLVVTVDMFQCGGYLRLYPAYKGANQLWKWGANNSLVSKMGLAADRDGSYCVANPPTGIEQQSWQYTNDLMKNNGYYGYVMTVDKTQMASYPYLAAVSGELSQKWMLVPEDKLAHL